MNSLTVRQREVLDFIEEATLANGYAPTVREIAKRFGMSSPNAAQQHLRALERKGFLDRRPKSGRTLTLLASSARLQQTIPLLGKVS